MIKKKVVGEEEGGGKKMKRFDKITIAEGGSLRFQPDEKVYGVCECVRACVRYKWIGANQYSGRRVERLDIEERGTAAGK